MRIVVLDPAGLHHNKSGFHAWAPGEEYDFPVDDGNRAWLEGQVARGAVRLLEELPQPEPEPAAENSAVADKTDAGSEPGAGDGQQAEAGHPGDDEQPAPLTAGQKVLYRGNNGQETERTIKSVNPDGTYDLGGAALKKVSRDRLTPIRGDGE